MTPLFGSWLLIAISLLASDQNRTIIVRGAVLDATLGKPLPGVEVVQGTMFNDTRFRVYSGSDGSYLAEGTVAEDARHIVVSARLLGFMTVTQAVPIAGDTMTVGFSLRRRTTFLEEAERDAILEIVRTLHQGNPDDRAPFCLVIDDSTGGFEPDAGLLRTAERATYPRPVLRIRDCPPTYTSMFTWPGKPKAPPGYVDPHVVTLRRIAAWTDSAVTQVSTHQGTVGYEYSCTIRRPGGGQRSRCRVVSSYIE